MANKGSKSEIKLTVGIGASAGGLAVLKKLVATFPQDRSIVYIIVQHLDPSHDSMLTELLSKECALPIHVAENRMHLQPDHVYVIPPNAYLEISKDKIKLTAPQQVRGMRMAIDHLFRSMADQCKRKCVGIVLSGAGNDGTAGLRVLKALGGLVIAQDPSLAEHPSMPENAIKDGVVDKVLPAENMMEAIETYLEHPYLEKIKDNESLVLEKGIKTIGSILEAQEDFDLEQYKPSTVQRRIIRRMGLVGAKKY